MDLIGQTARLDTMLDIDQSERLDEMLDIDRNNEPGPEPNRRQRQRHRRRNGRLTVPLGSDSGSVDEDHYAVPVNGETSFLDRITKEFGERSDRDTVSTTPSLVARHRCKRHGQEKGQRIRVLYGISFVLWVVLIIALGLWRTDIVGWVVLLVPPLVFLFGFINADKLTVEVEDQMFEANYLSVGLIIVLPLLMWINGQHGETTSPVDRRHFIQIVVVALVLSMLSMIDLWVPRESVSLIKHGKSIFQTASISLLIYALYWFVRKQDCPGGP